MSTSRDAASNLYPVRDAEGNGVGVVEFVDARATRAPWVAHIEGWFPVSHTMLEKAERTILAHAAHDAAEAKIV